MTNMTNMINLIDKLSTTHTLSYDEMYQLIEHRNEELANYLFEKASRCVSSTTATMSICAVSLNSPITVEMTATIAE